MRPVRELSGAVRQRAEAESWAPLDPGLMTEDEVGELARICDEALKRDILNQVKRELEELTGQTNISLEKITRAINARPTASPQQTFSKDYPQNGITHVVVSGDTLSAIARKYGSRVKWIQDANEIADPSRGLQVGKTIFVPRE